MILQLLMLFKNLQISLIANQIKYASIKVVEHPSPSPHPFSTFHRLLLKSEWNSKYRQRQIPKSCRQCFFYIVEVCISQTRYHNRFTIIYVNVYSTLLKKSAIELIIQNEDKFLSSRWLVYKTYVKHFVFNISTFVFVIHHLSMNM